MVDVIIVGGGAAGFFGAIASAETHPTAQVILLEAGRHPLAKVRISGGGRCNVTHACFDPAQLVTHYPRGGRALRGAFSRFQPRDTVNWFQKRGVVLKTEADGRMFPVTDDSETVVNALTRSAQDAGIKLWTGAAVTHVERFGDGFEVTLRSGAHLKGDRLLLATGSSPNGYALAQHLGHTVEPPVPSLFTFNIPDPALHELAGVSVDAAQVQLLIPGQSPLKQTGAVLVTHWGLSGPAVLKLSAWGARLLHDCRYEATVRINWCPNQSVEQVRAELQRFKENYPKRAIATSSPLSLPRRLWRYLVERAGIAASQSKHLVEDKHPMEERWANLSRRSLHRLVQELTQGDYPVRGKGVFKDEFVTCGGIRLKEVNFKTMESRCCPGLYLAGEVLDIDGVTGGFNFQSAWTTGWIAGTAIGAETAIEP